MTKYLTRKLNTRISYTHKQTYIIITFIGTALRETSRAVGKHTYQGKDNLITTAGNRLVTMNVKINSKDKILNIEQFSVEFLSTTRDEDGNGKDRDTPQREIILTYSSERLARDHIY